MASSLSDEETDNTNNGNSKLKFYLNLMVYTNEKTFLIAIQKK